MIDLANLNCHYNIILFYLCCSNISKYKSIVEYECSTVGIFYFLPIWSIILQPTPVRLSIYVFYLVACYTKYVYNFRMLCCACAPPTFTELALAHAFVAYYSRYSALQTAC